MLSRLARTLLACTAMGPVGLTYAWVAYNEGEPAIGCFIAAVCLALFLVCNALLRYAQKHMERSSFKIKAIEPADDQVTASLLLYMLPLFTAPFGALNWQVWVPAVLIFVFIVSAGYVFHFNPVLHIQGWHFYKVGTPEGVTYLFITKKHLKNVTANVTIGQLTEYILIDLED